jgi:hypothetical protein
MIQIAPGDKFQEDIVVLTTCRSKQNPDGKTYAGYHTTRYIGNFINKIMTMFNIENINNYLFDKKDSITLENNNISNPSFDNCFTKEAEQHHNKPSSDDPCKKFETKDSQAQLEVWEWKEKCYEEIKDIPTGGKIALILALNKPFSDEIKERLRNKNSPKP